MVFEVRAAVPDDARRIAELHVLTWQETYAHLLPPGFLDEAHSRMRREMWDRILRDGRPELTVRVAVSEGKIVGFAMSGPSQGGDAPRDRQLYNIYVLQAAHGTGIGQALLAGVLGAEPAMLWVAKENPRAIAFYRRNGFELDGATEFEAATPAITHVRMVR
ncbi:GNAT family N-acetyltransferase [uncultured Microbacterium sp.]|uniref:GNAT family N-acetyltransferase n=1 Tax=uncultured Microbacterium sp. TaxID=191216 RepID=UPI0028CFDB56|nr:GNAT family N-acetyltransferase [uncultured Microbacterium sp.]